VFAYEDVKTGMIKTTAFSSWQTIKDDVCAASRFTTVMKRESERARPRRLTNPAHDPICKMPEFKAAAVRIEKIS
jgi:hypothetical protein